MSDEFHARWMALVTAIRNKADARGIAPNAIEDHEADLKVSLPLEGTEYFLHSFKKHEVEHGDSAELADQVLADYEAHRTRMAMG